VLCCILVALAFSYLLLYLCTYSEKSKIILEVPASLLASLLCNVGNKVYSKKCSATCYVEGGYDTAGDMLTGDVTAKTRSWPNLVGYQRRNRPLLSYGYLPSRSCIFCTSMRTPTKQKRTQFQRSRHHNYLNYTFYLFNN